MTGEGELKLLSSVTCVKICAFCATGLEEAVLPEGLKDIGEDVFCNCGALRKVSFADVREFRPGALNWLRDALVEVALFKPLDFSNNFSFDLFWTAGI